MKTTPQAPPKTKSNKSSPLTAWDRFKQPRYIIPVILLPFIFLFYFIFNNWVGRKQTAEVKTDSIPADQINPNMPGVSSEVNEAIIKNKFGAYLEAYQHDKDASALDNIDNNPGARGDDLASAYTPEDLKRLQVNSVRSSSIESSQRNIDRQIAEIYAHANKQAAKSTANSSYEEMVKRFTDNTDNADRERSGKTGTHDEQMKLFRDQMVLVDSMQQAYTGRAKTTDDEYSAAESQSKGRKTLTNNFDKTKFDPDEDSSFQPLKVSRVHPKESSFNTVTGSQPDKEIKAILDQDVKAIAGSRVRIRLLSDIFVGGQLVPKGTILYGIVSGFQTQRINISINQIINENTMLPVKLDVFDTDGYIGLYVPGSTFREFTKEIGTQGTQGLSQVRTSDNSNATTGLISQVFQSASTSVSKLIQKEKAVLKYNYIISLRSRN